MHYPLRVGPPQRRPSLRPAPKYYSMASDGGCDEVGSEDSPNDDFYPDVPAQECVVQQVEVDPFEIVPRRAAALLPKVSEFPLCVCEQKRRSPRDELRSAGL